MKVGFIGLGRMGQGMANNLLKAKVDLVIYDVSAEACAPLVAKGASRAQSIADIASQADVLFTSLPGPAQIEEVIFGAEGVLNNMKPELVLFELSTSSLSLCRKIHALFAERGAAVLDAPISGGPAGAASGDLALWVGGDKEVFEKHLPLLRAIGNKASYVGPIGSGTIAKLSHNMLGYMFMASMSEVFSMATKAGMDPLDLWEAMKLGVVGRASAMTMLTSQFLPGKFETAAFALKLAHKDVTLATNLAKELGVPMRLANMTLEEMTEALGRGWGEHDSRAYMKLQLERAGVSIAVDPGRLQRAMTASNG